MLLKELLSVQRPIISKGDNNFEYILHDVVAAIESNSSYPWNVNFDMSYSFTDDEDFNQRIGIKEISKWEFGSDEDSILRVIVFDSKDIAYFSKSGDTRYWSWSFYSKEDMDNFLTFLRQVNDRLSSSNFLDDCVVNFEKDEHYCQYIDFEKINDEVYVKSFKGFPWALEKHNHPKKAFLIKENVLLEVNVVRWIENSSYDDNGNVLIEIHGEEIEIPVQKLRFSMN